MTDYHISSGTRASIDDCITTFEAMESSVDLLTIPPEQIDQWYHTLNKSQQQSVIVKLILLVRKLLVREIEDSCRDYDGGGL